MKIEHVYRIDLTAQERHTVELALWVMLRTAKDPGEAQRALELYDRLVDDRTRGGKRR